MDYIEKVSYLLKKYLLPVMAAWMVISMVGCVRNDTRAAAEPTETISTPTLQPAATAEPAGNSDSDSQVEAGQCGKKSSWMRPITMCKKRCKSEKCD
jgi:hypothetical protein